MKNLQYSDFRFQVRFSDFGNTRKCKLAELRRFRGISTNFLSLPPYCYQCSLAFVQPSQVNAPDGVWRKETNQLFAQKTDGIELEAEVNITSRNPTILLNPAQIHIYFCRFFPLLMALFECSSKQMVKTSTNS